MYFDAICENVEVALFEFDVILLGKVKAGIAENLILFC